MTYEISIERTLAKNQSTYNAMSGLASVCVHYVTSLTNIFICFIYLLFILKTTATLNWRMSSGRLKTVM
jgi:hypothetical protein